MTTDQELIERRGCPDCAKIRRSLAAADREIAMLKESRAKAVEQEQRMRVECNRLRSENAKWEEACRGHCDNLTRALRRTDEQRLLILSLNERIEHLGIYRNTNND